MGGNIFKDLAEPIALENIEPTLKAYKTRLAEIFPMKAISFQFFELVGSGGKKEISGDLDIAIDWTLIVRHFTKTEIEKWGVDYDKWEKRYTKISKRARTATDRMCKMRALLEEIKEIMFQAGIKVGGKSTAGNIFTCFPQFDEMGITNKHVQIDWMVGDAVWLRWAYYSHGEPNLKGLHRTQLIVAAFSEMNKTFNHFEGVKEKDSSEWTITSPSEAVECLSKLYGPLSIEETYTFKDLHSWLSKSAPKETYDAVIGRYLGILKLAKAEVPREIRLELTI